MIDFSSLEKKLVSFRNRLLKYRAICNELINHPTRGKRDPKLIDKEQALRGKLEVVYGELESSIHGMAGYVEKVVFGVNRKLFLEALSFRVEKQNSLKWNCLEYSIQCLNKAIGSCRNAGRVVEKDGQIIIAKNAQFEGSIWLRKIFHKAKLKLIVQDRYIDSDIFNFLADLDESINIRVLTANDQSKKKQLLKQIYQLFKARNANVEIREAPSTHFHSRKIGIDGTQGYISDFSIKDIGNNEGIITVIEPAFIINFFSEFESVWQIAVVL